MEQADALNLLVEYAATIPIELSQYQIDSFRTYLNHLQAWNKSTNLTTIINIDDIVIKHFIDSIAVLLVEKIREGATILDVGSGAGFPGIPLKIVRPDLQLTLVEPSPKKTSFLHFIVGCLRLQNTRIFDGTFERFLAESSLNSYEYITTRALRYDLVLGQCASFHGRVLIYTSKLLEKSMVGHQWHIDREWAFYLPQAKGSRAITVLSSAS